ncbi:DUF805 domain-containing protein [uncultured Maricaulis sp.]|uniref:DUF805 domain-containing protein n=1 Tax=uncultured Maricaulis sp. TaxID=174710 RepID=UPI0030D7ABBA
MSLNDFILQPADAQRVLFGSAGKLGPQAFAQGLIAIVVVNLLIQFLTLVPGLGLIFGLIGIVVGLASIYAWVCIYSKRFHDAGKSGWMTVAAIFGVIVVAIIAGAVLMPVFGGSLTANAGMIGGTPGSVMASNLSSLIANAAVGYFVYRL